MNTTNIAARIHTGLDSASPELLQQLSIALGDLARTQPTEAGEYWRSISNELLTLSYERRTGA